MKKHYFVTIILSVFVCFVLQGQQKPSISASLDTTKTKIGDQITLIVEIDPKGDSLSIPNYKSNEISSAELEILPDPKIDTIKSFFGKTSKYRISYKITSFEPGKIKIEGFHFKIGEEFLSIDPFELEFLAVAVDTLKQPLFGIKPLKEIEYTFSEILQIYWWVLLIVVLLCAAVWAFLYFREKKRIAKIPPEMLLSPYERAKFRLQKIDEEKLIDKGDVKQYYIELTDVIRNFLDEEYQINAPELTSDEILVKIKTNKLKLRKETIDKLKDLLFDADLVKFAKMFPSNTENVKYRQFTENIIEDLKRPDYQAANQQEQKQNKA